MKLTPSEAKLVELISAMPNGSYCPGADTPTLGHVHALIRKLERKGALTIEATDDGPRYTVREGV